MSKLVYLAATLALTVSATAGAACPYPAEIEIPNGAKATQAEMVAANASMKDYMAKIDTYLECLDREEAELGEAVNEEQKQLHTSRHNTAVDALNALAARYNEQVQAFKKAGGK